MKFYLGWTYAVVPLALVILIAIFARAGTTNLATQISGGSTIIVLESTNWTLDELSLSALKVLRDQGGMPVDAAPHPIVHITPRDTNIMCEFLYMQGFERPFWRVQVGYDGRVVGFQKKRAKEGGAH